MKNTCFIISILSCLVLSAFPATTNAQHSKWEVTDYKISFKIKNAGFTVHGTFKGLDAHINFDEQHPEKAKLEATIDAKSIKTGINMRDNDLKEEKYFDVAHYPVISMNSVSVQKNKEHTYTGRFKLTIKGKTKVISVPFTFTQQNDKGEFKGSFTVNRLDFGVGTSGFILADDADVTITVSVKQ
ncbi:MAG: YceI family protein [Chitinophagaceae bacterium]|nr:YceI family protein [Chitinophagaceae bacterium]